MSREQQQVLTNGSDYPRQVADELDRLQREVTTGQTEAERIRQGLRQWQSRHVGCTFADPDWPVADNHGHW